MIVKRHAPVVKSGLQILFGLPLAFAGIMTASRQEGMTMRCKLSMIGWFVFLLATAAPVLGQAMKNRGCLPVSQRTAEAGCWIMLNEPLGRLAQSPVYWHLDTYPNRAAAEAAKGSRGSVVEALGKLWLFTIGESGWRPPGGTHVAEVGPLLVKPGTKYTAQYMEGISPPGTTTPVHRHPGPEAWFTLTGELCLETPAGKTIGHPGEGTHVPAGPPMQLTASGSVQSSWVVLVLRETETSQPWEILASDWAPKGLCKNP
jgi:quercetin dioxygenase-like cupin family protein